MKIIKYALLMILLMPIFALAETEYDFYVDDSNTGVEDGSESKPYNTISEAIEAAEGNDEDDRKIFVSNGEYQEQVELADGVELYGESRGDTVIVGRDSSDNDFDWAVKMNHETVIKNFKVQYGKTGILVEEDSKADIEDCKIKDFDKIGIEAEKADRNNKYRLTVKDCKIYDGDGKAMYIRKRKIDIEDNEIFDNDEEGIDLRSKVKGDIEDNEIYSNGESGIEFEARGAKLEIEDNKLKNNNSSGITAQYRGKNKPGEVFVIDNSIKKNDEYGLRCSNPNGGTPPHDFFSSMFTLKKNDIYGNDNGNYSAMCHL